MLRIFIVCQWQMSTPINNTILDSIIIYTYRSRLEIRPV